MRFRNATPHPIVIRCGDTELVIPPTAPVARVQMVETLTGDVLNIPTITSGRRVIVGLDCEDGEIVIVSSMVLDAIGDDVEGTFVAPDTGPTAIRDSEGRVIAVTRLVRKA